MQRKQAMGEMFFAIAVASISVIICYGYTKYKDPKRLYRIYNGVGEPFANTSWALYYSSYENDKQDRAWSYWSNDPSITLRSPIPKTYPVNGFYSCKNKTLLKNHMHYLMNAGIDAIIVPWYNNHVDFRTPNRKKITDKALSKIISIAESTNIKVGIMIPDYSNRSWPTIMKDIQRYNSLYSGRSSILRLNRRPVIFIQNSQKIQNSMYYLTTRRRTPFDSYFVAQISTKEDIFEATESGYDAVCPIEGNEKDSWASNPSNWDEIQAMVKPRALVFIPVISPGDSATPRNAGKYYETRWEMALKYNNHVFINSFNGWFDGSNIEPATSIDEYKLSDENWVGENSNAFISLTRKYTEKFNVQDL